MVSMRHARQLSSALLLVALLALTIEAPFAAVRIVWRFAVLSFDSSATQLLDELACEASPPSQAGREADLGTRLAVTRPGAVASLDAPSRLASAALSSGITRSPPTA